MKKTVKIIGIGPRIQGSNAKGRAYDFQPLSICYKDEKTVGYRAERVNVNSDAIPPALSVGEEITVDLFWPKGRTVIRSIG